jgi:hypothetical protein
MTQVLPVVSRAILLLALFVGVIAVPAQAQTIDQRLLLVQNDHGVGGQFNVAVQVKGTGLGSANTLGSATIDVEYDNTKLTFASSSGWAFGGTQGYSRNAGAVAGAVRIAITGGSVNENGGGDPPGIDIGTSYTTWVQLNFTITSTVGTTSVTIAPGSNAIGLFANHQNEPNTGIITNGTLSAPSNLNAVALPIELVSFTASLGSGSGSSVVLKWKTLSEIDNLGFEVERSLEPSGSFALIPGSFQEGHGTTIEAQDYSFTDPNTEGKRYYYRLKQIDRSGAIHYSDAVQAMVTGVAEQQPLPTVYALEQNYPNPFNPTTGVRYQVPGVSDVKLIVYDLLGKAVATLVNERKAAGTYTVTFDASGLASGVYLYRLTAGGQVFMKKMLLVK